MLAIYEAVVRGMELKERKVDQGGECVWCVPHTQSLHSQVKNSCSAVMAVEDRWKRSPWRPSAASGGHTVASCLRLLQSLPEGFLWPWEFAEVKNPPANAGDLRDRCRFDSWVGKIPWRRK